MSRPPQEAPGASNRAAGHWQRPVVATYGLLLLVGSLLPAGGFPKIIDWGTLFSQDKLAHFGAYAVFALLLTLSFPANGRSATVLRAVLLSTAFGALMELLQGIAGTGREADPVDMVANLIGALLGGAVAYVLWNTLSTIRATARRD